MRHGAEGHQGGLGRDVELVAEGAEQLRHGVDDVAVLGALLVRAGEPALRVGVGAGGGAPGDGARQRVAGDAPVVPGDQELGGGAEERAVRCRHGEDGARRLGRPQSSQHRREGQDAIEVDLERPRQHDLLQGRPGLLHLLHGAGDLGAVAGAVERRGHPPDRDGRALAGVGVGRLGLGLGDRPVLPEHGVEQLVGVGQRLAGRPDGGGPATRHAAGVAGDAHGEARDHEVPGHGAGEGERAHGDGARAEPPDGVLAGDGGERVVGAARLDQLGGAPADEGQAGPVEERGGAAVELQGVGAVLERDGAGVEGGAGGGHGAGAGSGAPARVATTSWLRPPASGRMPTAENPASSSIRRRTGAGGRYATDSGR